MGSALLSLLASGGMRTVAMLVSYIDESGHSGDSRIVAMGGIVGSHLQMDALGNDWNVALRAHGIRVFRMSELEGSSGEFQGWSKQQRESLLADLFGCLEKHFALIFGAAVIVSQYRSLPELAQDVLMDPWFICFHICVSEAAGLVMWHRDDASIMDKVAVFIHQQREYQSRAISGFQFMKDNWDSGSRLGTCTPASTADIVQLQIADLIAYETRKHIENAIHNPHVPMRWPMKQLCRRPFNYRYLDFAGIVPDLQGGEFTTFSRLNFRITNRGLMLDTVAYKTHAEGWREPPKPLPPQSFMSRLLNGAAMFVKRLKRW